MRGSGSASADIFHSVSWFVQQPHFWFQSWSNIHHSTAHECLEFWDSNTAAHHWCKRQLYLHLSERLASDQYIPLILSSPYPSNVCKLQAVQCCLHQCSHQPRYCSIQIQLCHFLYHAALLEPWLVVFHSEHSGSYACLNTFQSTFEALHHLQRGEGAAWNLISLLILLALTKSNVLAVKIGYTLDNFQEAVPIFLLLTLEPLLQLLINVTWLRRE